MQVGSSREFKAGVPHEDILRACRLVSTERLRETVDAISFPRHIVHNLKANLRVGNWIMNAFDEMNLFPQPQGDCRNIIAKTTSAFHPEVIIGAHYDSVVSSPGADDNASAVAAMLESTLVLRSLFPKIKLWAVAFNGEEEDLLGSKDFVQRLRPKDIDSLREVHILEMVGFTSATQKNPAGLPNFLPPTGDFIGILGNAGAAAGCRNILQSAATYLPDQHAMSLVVPAEAVILAPVLGRSDHRSFWDVLLNAIMWTDTANYHLGSDTSDTLDYEFLTFVTKLMVASVATRFAKLG
jgi:hypothetical protein